MGDFCPLRMRRSKRCNPFKRWPTCSGAGPCAGFHRVRLRTPVGTATEADVLAIKQNEGLLCELIEGVLVEKGMGYTESILAIALAGILHAFTRPRRLGFVSGPDGSMRLLAGLVRIPDVAFTSVEHPDGRRPREPIPTLVPAHWRLKC